MDSIKTELKIVDLWYDFYARFLPGTIFISLIRWVMLRIDNVPSGEEIFVFIGAGYAAGLIIQPISSLLVDFLESIVERNEKNFVKKVRLTKGIPDTESKVLSKMHGETTFYTQLSVLSLVYFLLQIIFPTIVKYSLNIWPLACMIIFIGFAYISSKRRFSRAVDIERISIELGIIESPKH